MTEPMTAPPMPAGHPAGCDCSTCAVIRGAWSEPVEAMPSFDLAWHTNDYLRRIHWWVRLFGIIWIVIPVVFALIGVLFLLGGITAATVDKIPTSAQQKCISQGYGADECARMYPG